MANSALPIGLFNSNLINIQVFKSSGTYTPSTGVAKVLVRAWGGGGGGGTTNSGAIGGPGGGGGAYVEAFITNSTSQTITIGAGGTGGVANNGTNSTAGGDTSFGSLLVAKGGGRGESSGGNPGAGGDAASCTVPSGGLAISGTNGGNINALGSVFSIGGSSWGSLGQAFPPNVVTVNGTANAGQGGQGGNNAQNGGSGSAGLLIVYEYSSATPTTGSSAAIQSEMETGTATNVFVSPGMQQYHKSAAKAWVRFDASSGTPVINEAYNINNVADLGVGVYRADFTTAFSNNNICAVYTGGGSNGGGYISGVLFTLSSTSVGIDTWQISGTPGHYDTAVNSLVVFGDQ